MTERPTRNDLEHMTEPTRSKALDILQRLRQSGYDEADAVEIAFREAEEWEASHSPTAATPQESPRLARVRTTSAAENRDPLSSGGRGRSR